MDGILERKQRLEAIEARRRISVKPNVIHAVAMADIPEGGAVRDLVYSDIDWLLAEVERLTKQCSDLATEFQKGCEVVLKVQPQPPTGGE
jgi:hypothetical protein